MMMNVIEKEIINTRRLNSIPKNPVWHRTIVAIAVICILPIFSNAQIKLPKLISDGMVLQRGEHTQIWGWSSPNEDITIQFQDSQYRVKANKQGEWKLALSNLAVGGPYTMTLKAANSITIKNILVGDVWVCSGQSNMTITMERVSPLYQEEISSANNNLIRYFKTPEKYDFNQPLKDVEKGNWISVNSETILGYSAIAYFFANKLYNEHNIPIGLINSSLGGSPAQAWLSKEALKKFPEYDAECKQFQNTEFVDSIIQSDRNRTNNWYENLNRKDKGLKNASLNWKSVGFNDSDWETMNIPGFWKNESLGNINGAIWFRKEIEIPTGYLGKGAKIIMGRIVDADSIFINGKYVGSTSYQYPPRRYKIPEGVLVEGKNTIVIRVINSSGSGGFITDKPYELVMGEKKIDIKGEWKYKLGTEMEPLKSQTFIRWKAGGLYNGMIAPLTNYTIKGAIWYQGESNTAHPQGYQTLFTSMIKDWRTQWNQGDFPFLFVQLPNFMEAKPEPSESNWALLREEQLKSLNAPNTAMVVAIDLGEWNDIHPLNKKPVGERLALAAQKVAYGNNKVVYSGPTYQAMEIKENKIILTFNNIGTGLMIKGSGELKEIAIAGKDHKFVWAKAEIKGNQIIVWSNKVKKPLAVRYAWANNPANANLYNNEGLPATPFRTDHW